MSSGLITGLGTAAGLLTGLLAPLPAPPPVWAGGTGGLPLALFTQLYPQRGAIWRSAELFASSGERTGETWALRITEVPVYLEAAPSQVELQGPLRAEGDNVYTLDKLHFPADVAVQTDDVVIFTTAHASIQNAAWRVRGDIQPHTWRAGKVVVLAARLQSLPEGVG